MSRTPQYVSINMLGFFLVFFNLTNFSVVSLQASDEKEAGFVSIFNGKDLTGWEGKPEAWTVKDGAIAVTGGKGKRNWLIWRGGQPGDFELRLSFKYEKGNSGVQVRSKEISKFMVCGYQVEVASQEKMGLWHHSIAPEKYRSTLALAGEKTYFDPSGKKTIVKVADAKKVQAAFKEGKWNEMTIIAKGANLIQKINGVVFAELTDEDEKFSTRKGFIALQDHGKGTVAYFRSIRLKVMDR